MRQGIKTSEKTAALFVSDLHLHEKLPLTTQAFLSFLQIQVKQTEKLYLLGDIFESWVGDDEMNSPYHRPLIAALRAVSDSGVALFWMAGNRDFLVGERFATATGLTLLPDPFIITLAEQRVILTHGDAQCTDDRAYMAFRAQVRQPQWQQQFLSLPLEQRQQIAASLRQESRTAQHNAAPEILDVNPDTVQLLFDTSQARIMIQGHTHRPACHHYLQNDQNLTRYVLPDWELEAAIPRGGWLAAAQDGTRAFYDLQGKISDRFPEFFS